MRTYILRGVGGYHCLCLTIHDLNQLSKRDFPLTEFDLTDVFNITLAGSIKDKIESGKINFQLDDDIIPDTHYKVTLKISSTKTGKINVTSFTCK